MQVISGSPLISHFDDGQDSQFSEFHFEINHGHPIPLERAREICDESRSSGLQEAANTYGCVSALVDEPEVGHNVILGRTHPADLPDWTFLPHLHQSQRVIIMHARRGVRRVNPTVMFGRNALARHALNVSGRLPDGEFARHTVERTEGIIQHLLDGDDCYFQLKEPDEIVTPKLLNAYKQLKKRSGLSFEDFMRAVMSRFPRNATTAMDWNCPLADRYGRLFAFASGAASHGQGVVRKAVLEAVNINEDQSVLHSHWVYRSAA